MEFPNDENGSVLQSMQDAGMDLNREYNVEFWHVFKEETSAQEMERRVSALGIQTEVFDNSELDESDLFDDDEDGDDDGESFEGDDEEMELNEGFDVLCIVPMIPTHAGITEMEQKLGKIAESCGGEADGWGVLNADESEE
ncbi:MAG: ribonuclease E inhibitor RraB [Planctomycetota bacterium]|nr:MAG: ribonuclease E inhibitor RraB [Planctomycetota bacterium]